jgi:hypothetical protein
VARSHLPPLTPSPPNPLFRLFFSGDAGRGSEWIIVSFGACCVHCSFSRVFASLFMRQLSLFSGAPWLRLSRQRVFLLVHLFLQHGSCRRRVCFTRMVRRCLPVSFVLLRAGLFIVASLLSLLPVPSRLSRCMSEVSLCVVLVTGVRRFVSVGPPWELPCCFRLRRWRFQGTVQVLACGRSRQQAERQPF